MLKDLSLNILLFEALKEIPGYAIFIKELMTKKQKASIEDVGRL